MRIKLFVGLPGSGKTHAMNNLDDTWVKIDDIKSLSDLPASAPKLAIADPWFCVPENLQRAKDHLYSVYHKPAIDVVYFANKPEICISNANFRNDGRNVEAFIRRLSMVYKPPKRCANVYEASQKEI